MNIQVDVDGQRTEASAEAEADKPCGAKGSWATAFDRLDDKLLFGGNRPAWVWWVIAAAMFYLAAHVALAFARGWFPVGP